MSVLHSARIAVAAAAGTGAVASAMLLGAPMAQAAPPGPVSSVETAGPHFVPVRGGHGGGWGHGGGGHDGWGHGGWGHGGWGRGGWGNGGWDHRPWWRPWW